MPSNLFNAARMDDGDSSVIDLETYWVGLNLKEIVRATAQVGLSIQQILQEVEAMLSAKRKAGTLTYDDIELICKIEEAVAYIVEQLQDITATHGLLPPSNGIPPKDQ